LVPRLNHHGHASTCTEPSVTHLRSRVTHRTGAVHVWQMPASHQHGLAAWTKHSAAANARWLDAEETSSRPVPSDRFSTLPGGVTLRLRLKAETLGENHALSVSAPPSFAPRARPASCSLPAALWSPWPSWYRLDKGRSPKLGEMPPSSMARKASSMSTGMFWRRESSGDDGMWRLGDGDAEGAFA
jgi:hypothetical protein